MLYKWTRTRIMRLSTWDIVGRRGRARIRYLSCESMLLWLHPSDLLTNKWIEGLQGVTFVTDEQIRAVLLILLIWDTLEINTNMNIMLIEIQGRCTISQFRWMSDIIFSYLESSRPGVASKMQVNCGLLHHSSASRAIHLSSLEQ